MGAGFKPVGASRPSGSIPSPARLPNRFQIAKKNERENKELLEDFFLRIPH
jgi:hypothetical protein